MHRENLCIKDSGITAPRIFKFGTKIGNDLLYCVRENQHPHAYLSLYLSIFLFLQYFFFFFFFVTDFSAPMRASVFQFFTHLQRVEVYCVKENQGLFVRN